MANYIAYNGGCDTWIVEKFDKSIDWHNSEFKGTKEECEYKCQYEMEMANRSYNDDDYIIG